MADQFGDKTHDATPYRRQKAREEGQVARSQDLASAIMLVTALLAMMYLGGGIAASLGRFTVAQLGGEGWQGAQFDSGGFVSLCRAVFYEIGAMMLPLLGLLLVTAIIVNVGQTGLLFLPQKVGLDVSRISLFKGVQRLVSLNNLMRLGFGLFKIVVVAAVALASLWGRVDEILALGGADAGRIVIFTIDITLWTCLKIGVALVILALFDYGFQRWKHEQDLKMTTQEVREEMKTLQGDPQILARRRAIQRQMAMNQLGSAVPQADVVITNPTELAVAIRYEIETMPAPIVVAKGAGVVAQKIRRLALEHGIPIVERKELARALYKEVDINQPIPTQQFAAVAEVLRYVYELQGRTVPGARRPT